MMQFRVHHILCTNLYRGLGYSGAFCENMSQKVTFLREHLDEPLLLVTEGDAICEKCPNHSTPDYCSNGDNHVAIKDEKLLPILHLTKGQQYSYRVLCEQAGKYLTQEAFEDSCRGCEWYRSGICRFEDFDFTL